MKFGSKQAHGFVGFLRRLKGTLYVMTPSVEFDPRNVKAVSLIKGHAFIARSVITLLSSVPVVFGRCGFAEVVPTVVRFDFVNVVNFFRRPLSGHPEPDNSMGHIFIAANSEFDSSLIKKSYGVTRRVPFAQGNFPSQNPRIWRVIKDTAYEIYGKIAVSVFMSPTHGQIMPYLEAVSKR